MNMRKNVLGDAVDEVTKIGRVKVSGSAALLDKMTKNFAFPPGTFGSKSGPVYNPFPTLGSRVKKGKK